MAFSRQKLSGSTDGRPIAVAATATPGTLLHTAIAGTIIWDEIFLFANNRTNAPIALTVEWGGTANSDHIVESYSIPAYSALYPIAPGLSLQNGVAVRAFCDSASGINIVGYVNRITP